MVAVAAALALGTNAGAQLYSTPAEVTANPLVKGFTVSGLTLSQGQTRVTLDLAGGRLVGLLVQGQGAQEVARGLVLAWGGEEKNVADLARSLGAEEVKAQARTAQGFAEDSEGTVLRLKVTGSGNAERWSAYTSLLIHPDSAFPTTANAEGNSKAPNVLRVFSDFQCPYCKRMWDTAHRTWAAQPNVYRVVHYHFPLEQHENAEPAAIASECAAAQGKFWPYADQLFSRVEDWVPQPNPTAKFVEYARALKLNVGTFQKCLTSAAPRTAVRAQYAAGLKVDVRGTPSVYLNGVQMQDYSDAEEAALIRTVTAASPSAAQVIEARLKALR
ncbi:Protein-disulfide isomerase [Deinococcus hopiensis KR-140]|uniref:Protein-disulfide isomerase n=2 Tax=Deinococcus TaxID=1298 RepID=A0A1W1VFN6_9DEIO|nr:Protein-disulfide isomerase [Deinococcus hopiensis KR-140]